MPPTAVTLLVLTRRQLQRWCSSKLRPQPGTGSGSQKQRQHAPLSPTTGPFSNVPCVVFRSFLTLHGPEFSVLQLGRCAVEGLSFGDFVLEGRPPFPPHPYTHYTHLHAQSLHIGKANCSNRATSWFSLRLVLRLGGLFATIARCNLLRTWSDPAETAAKTNTVSIVVLRIPAAALDCTGVYEYIHGPRLSGPTRRRLV